MTSKKVTFQEPFEILPNIEYYFYNETLCFFEYHSSDSLHINEHDSLCECKKVCKFSFTLVKSKYIYYINDYLFTKTYLLNTIFTLIQEYNVVLNEHSNNLDIINTECDVQNHYFLHNQDYGWIFKYNDNIYKYVIKKYEKWSCIENNTTNINFQTLLEKLKKHSNKYKIYYITKKLENTNIQSEFKVKDPIIKKILKPQPMWINLQKNERISIQSCKNIYKYEYLHSMFYNKDGSKKEDTDSKTEILVKHDGFDLTFLMDKLKI